MNPILEKMIMHFVREALTPEAVKSAETQLVAFLWGLALKQDNKLELDMVHVIAEALGVAVPSA